jgi:hypothetical protein
VIPPQETQSKYFSNNTKEGNTTKPIEIFNALPSLDQFKSKTANRYEQELAGVIDLTEEFELVKEQFPILENKNNSISSETKDQRPFEDDFQYDDFDDDILGTIDLTEIAKQTSPPPPPTTKTFDNSKSKYFSSNSTASISTTPASSRYNAEKTQSSSTAIVSPVHRDSFEGEDLLLDDDYSFLNDESDTSLLDLNKSRDSVQASTPTAIQKPPQTETYQTKKTLSSPINIPPVEKSGPYSKVSVYIKCYF